MARDFSEQRNSKLVVAGSWSHESARRRRRRQAAKLDGVIDRPDAGKVKFPGLLAECVVATFILVLESAFPLRGRRLFLSIVVRTLVAVADGR